MVCGSGIALGLSMAMTQWRPAKASTPGAGADGIVNSVSGTYAEEVDIHVPTYYGLEPDLKLVYNSGEVDGTEGVGWNLNGNSIIDRAGAPSGGAPLYDSTDVFFLDGAKLIGNTSLGGTHVTQHMSYQRIQEDTTNNRWYIWEKDGTKKTYAPIYIARNLSNPGFNDVCRWGLSTVQDPEGHIVTYNYWHDAQSDANGDGNWYLDNITYNGYTIKLWRQSRPDIIAFAAGLSMGCTRYRLQTIEVKVGGSDRCAYTLAYATSGNTNRSLLSSIQEYGSDVTLSSSGIVTGGTSLPARTLSYFNPTGSGYWTHDSDGDIGSWNTLFQDISGDVNGDGKDDLIRIHNYGSSVARAQVYLANGTGYTYTSDVDVGSWNTSIRTYAADINGDGAVDLVRIYQSGTTTTAKAQVYLGNGKGGFTLAWDASIGTWNTNTQDTFVDVNGDGKADLVRIHNYGSSVARAQVNLSNGTGFPSTSDGDVGTWDTSIKNYFADVNGDGRADLVRIYQYGASVAKAQVYLGSVTGTFRLIWDDSVGGWNTNTQDFFVDVNGDGKADLVRIHNYGSSVARAAVYLSTGKGYWTLTSDGDVGAWDTSIKNYFADVNGDGTADLVRIYQYGASVAKAQVYLGDANGNFRLIWDDSIGTWSTSTEDSFADVNGDGKADLVRIHNYGSSVARAQVNLAVGGGATPPDLLTTSKNGFGGTTSIGYLPSTNWPSVNLSRGGGAFPTVNTLEVEDGRGNSGLTVYSYADALYSPSAQAFLGFRTEEAVVDSQGTAYTTTNHQSVQSVGQIDSLVTTNAAGQVYAAMKYVYTEGGNGVTTPYTSLMTQSDGYEYNLNTNARHTKVTYSYDTYGNETQVVSYGDVNLSPNNTQMVTVITYDYNVSAYIVDKEASKQDYSGTTVVPANMVKEELYYYDGATSTTTPPLRGELTRTDDWNNITGNFSSTAAAYDSYGNMISFTDARGATETTTFDPTYHQFVLQTSAPLGETASQTWNYVQGMVTSVSDANNATTTYVCDPLGRLVSVRDPNGATTTTQYVNTGNPTSQYVQTTLPDGSADGLWSREYTDGLGRTYLISNKSPTSGVTYNRQSVYADAGPDASQVSLWYVSTASPVYENYSYDGVGRLTQYTHADGSFATITYTLDANNKPCSILTDELGNVRKTWVDTNNELIQVQESDNSTTYDTFYVYDCLGDLLQTTDSAGHSNSYTYNSLGDMLASNNMDRGTTTYTYDAGGLPLTRTDAKGNLLTYAYDAYGRLISETSGSNVTQWFFDEPGHGASIGRLTRIVYPSGGGSESYIYGSGGELLSSTQTIGATSKTMASTYDLLGRPSTMTYPDGEIVSYGYNADGSLASVSGYVNSMTYGANGELLQIAYGNGTICNYTYDPNRLWLNTASVKLGSTTLYSASYNYDVAQRVTSMTQGVPTPETTNYTYDNLNRLLSVSGAQNETFAYDSTGNMTRNSALGTYTYGNAAHPHAVTAAGSNTYTYDANGNMLTGAGRSYTWDFGDRLASVSQGGVNSAYTYDSGENRISKTSGTTTTLYFGSGLEQTNGSSVQYYYASGMLVAQKDAAGNKTWFHSDRLGSTRLMTNGSGSIVKTYDYLPFGTVDAESGTLANDRTFTGHISDAETGLLYCGARYYDTVLGRFIASDTMDPSAVDDPQDLNTYSYCNNNPINAADPTGHYWVTVAHSLTYITIVVVTVVMFWFRIIDVVERVVHWVWVRTVIGTIFSWLSWTPIGFLYRWVLRPIISWVVRPIIQAYRMVLHFFVPVLHRIKVWFRYWVSPPPHRQASSPGPAPSHRPSGQEHAPHHEQGKHPSGGGRRGPGTIHHAVNHTAHTIRTVGHRLASNPISKAVRTVVKTVLSNKYKYAVAAVLGGGASLLFTSPELTTALAAAAINGAFRLWGAQFIGRAIGGAFDAWEFISAGSRVSRYWRLLIAIPVVTGFNYATSLLYNHFVRGKSFGSAERAANKTLWFASVPGNAFLQTTALFTGGEITSWANILNSFYVQSVTAIFGR